MNIGKRMGSLVLALVTAVQSQAISCMAMQWPNDEPLVQVAILLDTSNSMDGLIEQAKSQLWRVANDLAYASRCGRRPKLEIALYEYGNNRISAGENYIRQVLPFTADLDLVAQKLFALRTNGGQEYCGAVIRDAVNNLRWDRRDSVYKAMFIAGNEPFTQGPVYFRDSIAQAVRQGVRVNTIFCGNYSEGVQTQWQEGAIAGRGSYLIIDQNRQVVVDPTPYDVEITRLGAQLNETYVSYGYVSRMEMSKRKEADRLTANLPASAGAAPERAILKASSQYADAQWDVVSKVAKGQMAVSELKAKELPAELQGKSSAELERTLKDQHQKREALQSKLGELKMKRDTFLAEKQKTSTASGTATLDQAMRDAIRQQAGGLGYEFSSSH